MPDLRFGALAKPFDGLDFYTGTFFARSDADGRANIPVHTLRTEVCPAVVVSINDQNGRRGGGERDKCCQTKWQYKLH